MRTNIDIDDELLAQAMQAGPYLTKKDTVEAGLRLLARQAAYREILKWRGKLKWEGDESHDWVALNAQDGAEGLPPSDLAAMSVQEPRGTYTRATAEKPAAKSRAKSVGALRQSGCKPHAGD